MAQPLNVIKQIPVFVAEVREELVKSSWPSRKDLLGAAAVVVAASALLTAYIGLLDYVLTRIVTSVMK